MDKRLVIDMKIVFCLLVFIVVSCYNDRPLGAETEDAFLAYLARMIENNRKK